jgi:hypothetical protein
MVSAIGIISLNQSRERNEGIRDHISLPGCVGVIHIHRVKDR